jgi:transposase
VTAVTDREAALALIRELRGERLTAEQEVEVRQACWSACKILSGEGLSTNAIAKMLALDWHTIASFLAMERPPDTPGPNGARLWRTRTDGMSYAQIAARLGCDESTARRWAAGDEPPLPRGRPVKFTGADAA